jgi:hypothetical protein
MKGSVWRALTVAGVVTVVCAGAAFGANTTSFFDPGADSDSAPDITGVAITNDDAGVVTVKLTLANRPSSRRRPTTSQSASTWIRTRHRQRLHGAEYDHPTAVRSQSGESPNGFYTRRASVSPHRSASGL